MINTIILTIMLIIFICITVILARSIKKSLQLSAEELMLRDKIESHVKYEKLKTSVIDRLNKQNMRD